LERRSSNLSQPKRESMDIKAFISYSTTDKKYGAAAKAALD
jgi:hypothetical protein